MADARQDPRDFPVRRRLDAELHLHRLDDKEQIAAPDASISQGLGCDHQPGHRSSDQSAGGAVDLRFARGRLELPDLATDGRPDHAIARRRGSIRAVDQPSVRLVDGGDLVTGVAVRPGSGKTHGTLVPSLAQRDGRRGALADAPGT